MAISMVMVTTITATSAELMKKVWNWPEVSSSR